MKILLTIFSIFICLICFGQTPYPTPYQNLGGLNIAVRDTGGLMVRQTLVIPQYADTTAANLSPTKFYSSSIIFTTDSSFYWGRNKFATGWNKLSSSSGSGTSVNIYNSNGDLTGNRTLNASELNLFFDSLANYTAISRGNGNPDSAFLIIDNNNSLFAKIGYNVGGARALVTAEPTLATIQFINHGLLSSVQARDNGKLYLTADDTAYINRNSGQYAPVSDDTSLFTPLAINSTGAIAKLNSWNTFPSWQQTLTKSSLLTNDVNVTTNSNVVFNQTFSGSFGNATSSVNSQFGWDFRKSNAGATENGRLLLNNGTAAMTQTNTSGAGSFFTLLSSGITLQATDASGNYSKLSIPNNVGSGAMQVLTQDGLRYIFPRAQPLSGQSLVAVDNNGLLAWIGAGTDTTFTGVTNVIVDTNTNSICVYIGAESTCYPLSGDSVRVVGDTSICVYTNGVPDCFQSNGDTILAAGGIDSVTIIGNVFCIWSVGSSDCVNINNSNGFVTSAVLSADSSQYDFYSGATYLFSLPTLLRGLIAGSGIYISDTTIGGKPYTVVYNTGGGGGTLQDAFNAAPTANPQINAAGNNFNITNVGGNSTFTKNNNGSNSTQYGFEDASFIVLNATDTGQNNFSVGPSGIGIISNSPSTGGQQTTFSSTPFSIDFGFTGTSGSNSGVLHFDSSKAILRSSVVDSFIRFGINVIDDSPLAPLHVIGDGSITAAFMNGNVGIGTTSPVGLLEIDGGGGQDVIIHNVDEIELKSILYSQIQSNDYTQLIGGGQEFDSAASYLKLRADSAALWSGWSSNSSEITMTPGRIDMWSNRNHVAPAASYFQQVDRGITLASSNDVYANLLVGDNQISFSSAQSGGAGGIFERGNISVNNGIYSIGNNGDSSILENDFPTNHFLGTNVLFDGNVGIGTTIPDAALHVVGGTITDSIRIGNDWFYTLKITLTPTEINSLLSSPVLAIPSPGVGKAIDIISVTARSVFNTTSYASTQLIQVSSNSIPFFQFNNFDISLGASIGDKAMQIAAVGTAIFLEDTPIYISADADNTDGDSDVSVYIHYRIINL